MARQIHQVETPGVQFFRTTTVPIGAVQARTLIEEEFIASKNMPICLKIAIMVPSISVSGIRFYGRALISVQVFSKQTDSIMSVSYFRYDGGLDG